MSSATFEKLDDGTFAGRIPACQGVVAFGDTLMECQRRLQLTLEDWLLLGLRMRQATPVLAGLSLNGELASEPLDAVSAQCLHPQAAPTGFRRTVLRGAAPVHGLSEPTLGGSIQRGVLRTATPSDDP